MVEFVPFDLNIHKEEFRQLDLEYNTWLLDQMRTRTYKGRTVSEIVEGHLGIFTSLKPPEGILYLLVVDEEVVGMGGLSRLRDEVARVTQMYIRPNFRGRGYGKHMLNRLLKDGRKFGYSIFQLRSPIFGHVALHLYRSAGFKEIGDYSESMIPEMPSEFRPYWIDMEKKE